MDDDLEKAERFQRLFVSPLVEGVRKELTPLVKVQADLSARVGKLEKNFARAVGGLSVAAAVFSVLFGIVLDWVKKRLGLGHH